MVELIEKYIDPAFLWCKKAVKNIGIFFVNAYKFLKRANTDYPRIVKGIISLVLVAALTFGVVEYTGVTKACEVHVNGVAIGCVPTDYDVKVAKDLAKKLVYDKSGKNEIENLSFSNVFVGSRNITTPENLVDLIIENTPGINKVAVLTVENKLVGYASTEEEIKAMLDELVKSKQNGSNVISAELHHTVKIFSSYVSNTAFAQGSNLSTKIYEKGVIPLKTIKYETSKKTVKYSTTYQKDPNMYENSERTVIYGENGLNEVVEKVGYIGGKEVSRETVKVTVITEPSNAVVKVGTKPYSKGENAVGRPSAKGFIWPVDTSVYNVITSYWGDGRGHKGYDIACAKGTKIYAVQTGTVIESQWSNSYGYFITIDHGNGVTTRYAHCSKLFSRVGETVSQGENIALVGSTGWSTGPHVHFEVRINGVPQNPKYYISR